MAANATVLRISDRYNDRGFTERSRLSLGGSVAGGPYPSGLPLGALLVELQAAGAGQLGLDVLPDGDRAVELRVVVIDTAGQCLDDGVDVAVVEERGRAA